MLLFFYLLLSNEINTLPQSQIKSGYILKGISRVYQKPAFTAEPHAKIKGKGYFKVLKAGAKCTFGRWYQITPEGWVCSGWFIPSTSPPGGTFNWSMGFSPGNYFYDIKKYSSLAVTLSDFGRGKFRRLRKLRGFMPTSQFFIGNYPWFRLFENGFISTSGLKPYKHSTLSGLTLKAKELPVAFITSARGTPLLRKKIENGKVGYKPSGQVSQYSIRSIKKITGDYILLKSPKDFWIKRTDASVAFKIPSQNPNVKPDEQWIDVDLDENIVYARKGSKVVRVMLSSTSDETPSGIFRIYWKTVWQTFDRQRQKDAYFLEAVPFVMYFKESFGFHGAYWHDEFGRIKTHGCINLSIADAKWLFNFSNPVLEDGFFSLKSSISNPGTLVRLRRSK
ncbi:MAG: L,D-transpeptidase [Deltaproteobacteria bacterium]|nr:L,D-transpeptidase [Deltaproteobacteria bacterium]